MKDHRIGLVRHRAKHLSIECSAGRRLLAATAFLHSLSRLAARREFRGRHVIEEVDVLLGNARVQRLDAATRDDDEPLRRDSVAVLHPAQERNPVEDLVADLGEPRTRDDRRSTRRNAAELLLDFGDGEGHCGVLLRAGAPPCPPDERLVQRQQTARGLASEIADNRGSIDHGGYEIPMRSLTPAVVASMT